MLSKWKTWKKKKGKHESPQNLEVIWNEGELFSGGRKQPAQETICSSDGKACAYNAGDLGLIPGG